tara:strand:+ start:707 stop:820 length:114 start_codon:yes stop_codon:yes gene_type:complete
MIETSMELGDWMKVLGVSLVGLAVSLYVLYKATRNKD